MDTGNNAWVLTSAALILFMTPGLAFFYGGMVRSKNVLGMLMQNVFAMGLISVIWAVVGFSLAFGGDSSLIGNLDYAGLKDVATTDFVPNGMTFFAFQMMFAVITPALITGATADRLKFSSYALFIALWSLIVYSPVAHWVWDAGGWIFDMGPIPPAAQLLGLLQLLEHLHAQVRHPHGLRFQWSEEWFPGAAIQLRWCGREAGGHWYWWEDQERDLWLPGCFIERYCECSPEEIWVAVAPEHGADADVPESEQYA